MRCVDTKEYIKAVQSLTEKKIYIAGAGKYGEVLGRYFDKSGITWEGFVDKRSSILLDRTKKVYIYEQMKESDGYFIISSYEYREDIERQLIEVGIKSDNILIYEKQDIFYDIYDHLIGWKQYTKKVKRFCDLYKNKRCFIVGNGPSLRINDLEKLNDEVTFASNAIYALYKLTDWRPTYYCAWDPVFCKEMMSKKENINVLIDGCKAAFTSILGEGIQFREDIEKLFYIKPIIKLLKDGMPCFSSYPDEQVYASGTITYAMLQLAVYMGFNQIYLLGMDFSYSVERYKNGRVIENKITNHMEEIQKEDNKLAKKIFSRYGFSYVADIDLQLNGYKAAKKYAEENGIKIYNATRGGKLEIFERVEYDTLF